MELCARIKEKDEKTYCPVYGCLQTGRTDKTVKGNGILMNAIHSIIKINK